MIKNKPSKNRYSILLTILIIAGTGMLTCQSSLADTPQDKKNATAQKVLYIASYNIKNPWSSAIKSGIESVLETRENIRFTAKSMDTMGVQSEENKEQAALNVKNFIDTWQPDIVIASDDNASKYLIVPYFKDSDLSFVFCGVNWDAAKYGFPSKNVTGMIEVQLVDQLVDYLSDYAKGDKVGSIRGNTMTNRIEAKHFEQQLGMGINTHFVKTITEWKQLFIRLQNEVDMILLGDIDTIKMEGTSKKELENFIFENTKIPTGHWDAWFKKNALITLATVPEEQGEWAAKAALQILDGKSPMDIPMVKNKKAKIFLNMKLAKKLKIIFPMELIEIAELIPAN